MNSTVHTQVCCKCLPVTNTTPMSKLDKYMLTINKSRFRLKLTFIRNRGLAPYSAYCLFPCGGLFHSEDQASQLFVETRLHLEMLAVVKEHPHLSMGTRMRGEPTRRRLTARAQEGINSKDNIMEPLNFKWV